MKILNILLAILIGTTLVLNIGHTKETTSEFSLFSKERQGIRLHKKGKYKKAYKYLHETAQWGLKDSQYFLGIMYLKGQFVKQNVIKGLGYLGVANEAEIKNRVDLFNNVYQTLPREKQKQVDITVEEYINKIGMKVKSIKCSKSKDVGSRVPVVNCNFYKVNIGGDSVE